MTIYYFGCIDVLGHYLYEEGCARRVSYDRRKEMPWREIDGALCPRLTDEREPEGKAALCHQGGWTALAFWDRSVDRRMGSNSAFFVNETLDGEAMIAVARRAFPTVWSRFPFAVTICSVPGEAIPSPGGQ